MSTSTPVAQSAEQFTFKSLVLPFYLPGFLAALGVGIAVPLLPLYAESFNNSGALAGIIVGMYGLGSLAANIPAGALSSIMGDRWTMLLSVGLQVAGAAGATFAPTPFVLGASVFVLGASQAIMFVSRLSFFRRLVPGSHRGRALALVGGEYRLGSSIGPVIGGFIAGSAGYPETFAGLALLSAAVLFISVLWVPRAGLLARKSGSAVAADGVPPAGAVPAGAVPAAAVPAAAPVTLAKIVSGILGGFRGNGKTFATAGLAIIMLQLVRSGRSVVLPLWGKTIGLSVEQVGITVGIMFMVEMLIFFPAGLIMDRFGRKWSAVPCLMILAVSMALLPLSHTWAVYILLASLTGVGNGLGSGINMTLSTDFAPRENPGSFIGAWRFVVDGGTAGGPFIVGAVKALASLSLTGITIGAFSLFGALVMLFGVKETRKGREVAKSD